MVTNGFSPFIGHAYRNLGVINYVVSHGHFDSSKMPYQSWPGAFILSAIGVEIGGLNLESMLNIFLLFIQLLGAYIMVVNRQIGQDLPPLHRYKPSGESLV